MIVDTIGTDNSESFLTAHHKRCASIKSSFKKILIIGLGQIGLPVAMHALKKGFEVYGYDISEKMQEYAHKTTGIKIARDFKGFDAYLVCVSTHKQDDMFTPQIDGVLAVAKKISREAEDGSLVVIESTIPKGTSIKVFEMLNARLHVAHVPHRYYKNQEKEHGVDQIRVAGGISDCCLQSAKNLYEPRETQEHQQLSSSSKSLDIPLHKVSEIGIAELTKIIENAHRYLQISFAEELYLYCQAHKIGFTELRDALNTKWNVQILEPQKGIGGHCLPKDTKMYLQSAQPMKSKLLSAAIEVDDDYRRHISREQEVQEQQSQQQQLLGFAKVATTSSNPTTTAAVEVL